MDATLTELARQAYPAVAGKARELTDYLLDLHSAGKLNTDFRTLDARLAYHAPCHLRALHHRTGAELAELIPGVRADRLAPSCCGMGGTYGLQKGKLGLSPAMGAPVLEGLRAGAAPPPG